MRRAPRLTPLRAAGLCCAAGAVGTALPGCATLREEGFTQGGSCDPVVQALDRSELVPRPDELAGDLFIGPGAPGDTHGALLPGGANGMSAVGCGPAGCGPGVPTRPALGGAYAAAAAGVANGAAAERANRPDLAAGHYRQALMADPACPGAHHRLAVLLDGARQYPAAEQHYAAALAARPHDADLLCDAGYSLLLQGRTGEAETRFRTALSKNPDHARSLENLGLLYARRGDRPAAAAALAATGAPGWDAKLAVLFPAAVPAAPTAALTPDPAPPAAAGVPAVRVAAATAPPAARVEPAAATAPAAEPTGLPLWGGLRTPDPAEFAPVPTAAPARPAPPAVAAAPAVTAPVAAPAAEPKTLPLWPPVGGFPGP